MMFQKVFLFVFLVTTTTLQAQEQIIPRYAPAGLILPNPRALPAVQAISAGEMQQRQRLTHLEQAAFHLEAAGRTEEAKAIREEISSLQREAEIESLRSRISELQTRLAELTTPEFCIELDCQLMQVPPQLLEKFKTPAAEQMPHPGMITFNGEIQKVLEELQKSKEVKMLSSPKLRVLPGHVAKIQVGGEIAFPVTVGQKHELLFRDIGFSMETKVARHSED
ncbi:MAG: hypothetical protein KDA78_08150, partial [Planctomycetaceae bacterium]|nr:hypothetical protein [Planctomycetaceae bacterium]